MTTLKEASKIEKRLAVHKEVMNILLEAEIGLSKEEASTAAMKLCRLFRPELFQGR